MLHIKEKKKKIRLSFSTQLVLYVLSISSCFGLQTTKIPYKVLLSCQSDPSLKLTVGSTNYPFAVERHQKTNFNIACLPKRRFRFLGVSVRIQKEPFLQRANLIGHIGMSLQGYGRKTHLQNPGVHCVYKPSRRVASFLGFLDSLKYKSSNTAIF